MTSSHNHGSKASNARIAGTIDTPSTPLIRRTPCAGAVTPGGTIESGTFSG